MSAFFVTSKLVWFVAAPTNALLMLLCLGTLLLWRGWRRGGRALVTLAVVLLVVCGVSPLGPLLLRGLEDRFPRGTEPEAPTGVVVLGGSTDEVISDARDQVTLTDAATRITEAVVLARRYPEARIVFSGGSGVFLQQPRTEAEDARRLWIAMGIAPERITIEDRSRNTYENALFTKRLIEPQPGDSWILVTSAFHMPRSVGLFRAVGFPVIPHPVDYRTAGTGADLIPPRSVVLNFQRVEVAVREYIGLAVYRLTGRTDTLFPTP